MFTISHQVSDSTEYCLYNKADSSNELAILGFDISNVKPSNTAALTVTRINAVSTSAISYDIATLGYRLDYSSQWGAGTVSTFSGSAIIGRYNFGNGVPLLKTYKYPFHIGNTSGFSYKAISAGLVAGDSYSITIFCDEI